MTIDNQQSAIKNHQLYTPADVARMFKISRSQVYKLIDQGQIPAVRIGRSIRIRPSDLQKFIQYNTYT